MGVERATHTDVSKNPKRGVHDTLVTMTSATPATIQDEETTRPVSMED